jgi:hypothetical protein
MSGGIITTHRWYVVYSFVEAVHVGSMDGFAYILIYLSGVDNGFCDMGGGID